HIVRERRVYMAVNQAREGQGRVEGGSTAAYDAPTRQVRAVDDARDLDVNVSTRAQAQVPRERAYWGAIWVGLVGTVTSFVLVSLLGLAVAMSLLSSHGTSVLPSEGTGSIIWETVAGIVAYFVGGYVA